ncbi:DMT family transporter [Brevundimonas faecalis]|uniref:Drug/metabolite transporter (DMT)-like permease n=1 Tax=Brevundimonas faecalis TaxID=947378 RepID=A0ABV2RA70_9CAUL
MAASSRFWGVASGMAAGALWGLVFLAPKVAPEASPMMLTAGRYLAYGLIAALLIAPRWRRVVAALDWKAWRALIWLSLAGNIVYFVFLVVGVHFAGVGASALIVGMVPVVVALWGLKDKDSPPLTRVAPPIVVAALAVGLIGWESLSQGSGGEHGGVQTLIGLACALAALLSWSAFAVGNSRWMVRLPAVTPHEWSLLTGVVTGGLALLLAVPAVLTMGPSSGEAWMRLIGVSLGVAVFASIIGNAFWNQASRLLPLTMLGQMIVSETLFAFLYGFLWEGRGPTVIEVIAMILMVVSVIWCVRAHRPAALAAAEGDH